MLYFMVVVVICLISFGTSNSSSPRTPKLHNNATDKVDTMLKDNDTLVNSTLSERNATGYQHTTTNTTVSSLETSTEDIISNVTTNTTARSSEDVIITNTSFANVTFVDTKKPFLHSNASPGDNEPIVSSDPTDLPSVVQDIDEGLVAGMSVLVVAVFGGCFLFGVIRICYKNRQRKTGSTFYEEVEDAATSCSIEGSSNVKFLIGRARNINKSRIEQINEEWRTGKPLITPISSEINAQSSQDTEMKDFSKSSMRSQKRKIIEDEDSEYATAEPEEDLYSIAGSEGEQESGVTTDNVRKMSNINTNISHLEQSILQRSNAFDDGQEDPYEEGPEDEYDQLGLSRKHKILSISSNEPCDEDTEDEHLYELTDETEYALPGDSRPRLNEPAPCNNRPRLSEPLHRCKSQDSLTEKTTPTQSNSKTSSDDNVYNVSFEGEYDLLNKPRFRITISSDNYDSVQLPWECDNVQSETKTNQVSDSGHFDGLENSCKAESNIYSDMESMLQTSSDDNANTDPSAETKVEIFAATAEKYVHEVNGNTAESSNESSVINDIENNSVQLSGRRRHISEERPYSFASQISSGFSSDSSSSSVENVNEIMTPKNNNVDKTFCNIDPMVVQNKCFEYKIENGNITSARVNGLDLSNTKDDEIINLAEKC